MIDVAVCGTASRTAARWFVLRTVHRTSSVKEEKHCELHCATRCCSVSDSCRDHCCPCLCRLNVYSRTVYSHIGRLQHCLCWCLAYYPHRRHSRGEGFYLVCRCVCFSIRYVENRCSLDHQSWHRNVPGWVLENRLFWGLKVKVTGHKNTAGVCLCTLMSAGF